MNGAVEPEIFHKHILEYLLNLSTHPVPNIRLYAAKCLSSTVLACSYFSQESLHEMIGLRVSELKQDKDRDVRANTILIHVKDEVLKLSVVLNKLNDLEVANISSDNEAKQQDLILDHTLDTTANTTLSNESDTIIETLSTSKETEMNSPRVEKSEGIKEEPTEKNNVPLEKETLEQMPEENVPELDTLKQANYEEEW